MLRGGLVTWDRHDDISLDTTNWLLPGSSREGTIAKRHARSGLGHRIDSQGLPCSLRGCGGERFGCPFHSGGTGAVRQGLRPLLERDDSVSTIAGARKGDLLIATFWIRNLNTDSRVLELVPAFQNEAG